MKNILILLALLVSYSGFSQVLRDFPLGPDQSITPGSLCDQPTEIRYPEQIKYCERDVSSQTKDYVFREYNQQLGFALSVRSDYKVDHFIPLCAGGSNKDNNLWPQHVTIYTQTDGFEELGCKQLSRGKIKQAQLVTLVRQVKRNLKLLPAAIKMLGEL